MTKMIICMVCFGMVLGEIVTILPASAPKYQKPYHTETAYFHGRRVYPVAPFWSEMYAFGMVLVCFFFVRNGCKAGDKRAAFLSRRLSPSQSAHTQARILKPSAAGRFVSTGNGRMIFTPPYHLVEPHSFRHQKHHG
jgi:hypothetical protein